MYVAFENDHQLLIGCDNVDLLSAMQETMDGKKVYRKNQIIVPLRAGPKLFRFKNTGDINFGTNVKEKILDISNEIKRRKANIKVIKESYNTNNIPFNYELKGIYPPLEHQKTIYHAIMQNRISAIIAEAGTCKTGPYLWAIDERIRRGEIKRCLVITLSHLKKNVLAEMKIQTPNLKGVVLENRSRCDKILNKKFKSDKKNLDYDVYIANYESMFTLVELFDDNFFQFVIADEAHRIGSPKSRQTETIIDKFENTKYKSIITGSLNSNNTLSFYMPFRFLGPDTVPEAKYWSFRQIYQRAVDTDKRIWVDLAGTKDLVKNIIGNISVYFSKRDCLDLPDKIYKKMTCELDTTQKKYYDQVKNDLLLILDDMCKKCSAKDICTRKTCDNEIAIKSALVMVGKLNQICCGFYRNTRYKINDNGTKVDDSNIITFDKNPKLDLLMNVINDIDINQKIIIWTGYTHAIELIKDRINKAYGNESYVTAYKDFDAFKQVERFKDSDKRFLIANPSKAGTGLNIQFSNYQIFFSNNYSFIQRDQAESRQDRKGQKNNVTIIDLLCENSIDVEILKILMNKEDLAHRLNSLAKVI